MKETLEWIHDNGGHIAILSDANTFYIDTILKHHGVLHLIQKVVTNKGYFDENNRLRVGRFHDRSLPPHSCAIGCPANLCKGRELKQIVDEYMYEKVYYCGDGMNDYCPMVTLKRVGRPLHKFLETQSDHKVTAKILKWQHAEDLQIHLESTIASQVSAVSGDRHKKTVWIPLESNPEVLNKFAYRLGLPDTWAFNDVWSLDEESLQFIPRPVVAVVFLFPVTERYEKFRKEEQERIQRQGQLVPPKELYFVRQTIPNACGTIGLIHSLSNNADILGVSESGFIAKLLNETSNQTPDHRALFLESSHELERIHDSFSREGQTEAPSQDEEVDLHFVCFVEKEGQLWEMDGRKPFPIHHGTCSDLLSDSARVIQGFMERDPDQVEFTILALSMG